MKRRQKYGTRKYMLIVSKDNYKYYKQLANIGIYITEKRGKNKQIDKIYANNPSFIYLYCPAVGKGTSKRFKVLYVKLLSGIICIKITGDLRHSRNWRHEKTLANIINKH